EDERIKEYQNEMTHSPGVEGNNCQAILHGIKELLSSMRIGNGEKDLTLALEFSETNSSGGRGDELLYNNLWKRRISFSG
nr:hypothetical protein [Tanacetum cinerariifolium]